MDSVKEIKQGIKGLIVDLDEVVKEINNNTNKFVDVCKKFHEFNESLEMFEFSERGWSFEFDSDEIEEGLYKAFRERVGFNALSSSATDLDEEISDYIYELSESKQDKLNEKYGDLSDIANELESFEENSIEELFDLLDDVKERLKAML